MRRLVAAALVAAALAGCGDSSSDRAEPGVVTSGATDASDSTSPASTVERDRKRRDDDISQATADSLHECAAVVARLMHFDVSWLTSSTPPDTVAEVDPELLATSRATCTTAKDLLAADLDPRAGIGQAIVLDEQIHLLVDALDADEVNLAADSGMAMMILNIQGTIDGSFATRNPIVITP